MFITIVSKHFNINPDNIAVPIAASLGDVVTLAILSYMGSVFFNYSNKLITKSLIIFMKKIPLLYFFSFRAPFWYSCWHNGILCVDYTIIGLLLR